MDKEQINYKLKHLLPYLFGKYKNSGYKLTPKDERDYKIGWLFGKSSYKPKYNEIDIPTISVKDQNQFNICCFSSIVGAKEIDEKLKLSQRDIVSYAKTKGYVEGNGYSNLRNAQQSLKDYGDRDLQQCPDGNYIQNNDFNGFVNCRLNPEQAAVHKSKTFWSIETKEELFEQLDNKRPVHLAMPWYSGYNQSGGFRAPWLITKTLGYFVGGHAVFARGYIRNFRNLGIDVIKIQNSYSSAWGDNGCFYVEVNFLVKMFNMNGYGAYVNLDIESGTGAFISKYDGKSVKSKNNPAIYHIQKGSKKLYPNWETYLAFDGNLRGFETLSEQDAKILETIPNGDNMDITKSYYWSVLENSVDWARVKEIKNADQKNKLINALFQMQANKNLGLPIMDGIN